MKFLIPVESIKGNLGGVILYDPHNNEVLNQYVHTQRKDLPRSGWRGGVLYNNYLITTDWTDLHYFDYVNWKFIKSFKRNTFNDLHCLVINGDLLYIVNTGIDAIEIMSNPLEPKPKDLIFIFEKNKIFKKRKINLNEKFNKQYKIEPHVCHPNALEIVNDKMFVTCFEDQTRGNRTGKVIELTSGKLLIKNQNCHDADFYKNDFYLSGTRENKVYVLKDILNRKWPVKVDEVINLAPNKGWWRGSIIKDDYMYLCASFAYGIDRPFKMIILNLKTKKIEQVNKLPVLAGKVWDTVYQPILLKGEN